MAVLMPRAFNWLRMTSVPQETDFDAAIVNGTIDVHGHATDQLKPCTNSKGMKYGD